MLDLKLLVKKRIDALGVKEAATHFGVSVGTVSNWQSGKTSPSVDAVQLSLLDEGITLGEELKKDPEIVMWEGKKVIILSPVYKFFHPYTHFTLFANYAKYGPDKLGMIVEGMTLVYEARNILCHKVMQTDFETAIMFDDDMVFPCGNVDIFNGRFQAGVSAESAGFNTISRLMSHGTDKGIVGVTYFGRREDSKAQCSEAFNDATHSSAYKNQEYKGLRPVDWVGTGGMKIERWVLEKMFAAIDSGKWPECTKPREDHWRGPFSPKQAGTGEDVSFCLRAKEIGIQAYIDASLICLHMGDRMYGPNKKQ